MSDTSGRIKYSPSRKKSIKVKTEAVSLSLGGGGRAKASTKQAVPGTPIIQLNLPKELVWGLLHDDGLLTKAYNDSELIAFLKLMAEFIEMSADSGLEAVVEKFNVETDSSFSLLQRRIREQIDQQHSSEFNGAAKRAFQVGSTTWAGRLLKQTDPTKFKLARLVEVVRQQVEMALLLAPRLILQDYGERLLTSALPGGEGNRKVVEATIKAFRQQFNSFMEEHKDPAEWVSDKIAATVKKYEKILWT
jgi:hypothetical protein